MKISVFLTFERGTLSSTDAVQISTTKGEKGVNQISKLAIGAENRCWLAINIKSMWQGRGRGKGKRLRLLVKKKIMKNILPK